MHELLIQWVRSASRSGLRAPVLAFTLACFSPVGIAAETPSPEPKAETKTPVAMTPELEQKLAEFLKKAREAKSKIWEADMQNNVEEIVKVTGLDADGVEVLKASVAPAITSAIDEWASKLEKTWRGFADDAPPEALEMANQALSQVDLAVRADWFGSTVRPDAQAPWRAGLQAALSAEQFAKWEQAEKVQREAALAEIAGVIRASRERAYEEARKSLEKQAATITNALGLSKERVANFTALAAEIANFHVEKWKERAVAFLLSRDAETRRNADPNGPLLISPDPDDQKALQTSWDAGIAKLLSADEQARLKSSEVGGRQLRIRALARVLLLYLDEQVAFTAEQRERLLPIAERLVGAVSSLTGDVEGNRNFAISSQQLATAGRAATETELQTILDVVQLRRWNEACSSKSSSNRARVAVLGAAGAPVKADPPGKVYEPEDLENAISDHLYEQAAAERKRLLAVQMLKAEDAARVTQLTPTAAARLQTAARGAAEEELTQWKATTEQSIRNQLHDVTPENVRQRLAGMERFGIVRRSTPNPDSGSLWDQTVKAELTDAQRAAWKTERQARSAYSEQGISNLILVEFNRRVPLTAAQWQKLDPLLSTAVKDYAPDIQGMFSYSYGSFWYLQSYTLFIPVAAVPEKELKAILTKEQIDRWMSGEEFGNVSSYWENVQRLHANRVKERKQ